jgi:hypothetical protein
MVNNSPNIVRTGGNDGLERAEITTPTQFCACNCKEPHEDVGTLIGAKQCKLAYVNLLRNLVESIAMSLYDMQVRADKSVNFSVWSIIRFVTDS